MYYDFKVKIPEVKGKIYERTIKGVVYINYEYDRVYKPDKMIIPAPIEPPVRTLRATIPENGSHNFRSFRATMMASIL